MADECIPASPLSYKAHKRKLKVQSRRSKRHRGNAFKPPTVVASESVAPVESELLVRAELSTIFEETPTEVDITALYLSDPEEELPDSQNVDIFAEIRLLERANRVPPTRTNVIAPILLGQGLSAFSEIAKQHPPASAASETQPELSATQLSRLCQVADAAAGFQRKVSKQGNSSVDMAPVTTPQTSRLPANVELDCSTHSDDSPTKPRSPPRKVLHVEEQAGYLRLKCNKRIEKVSRKQINFDANPAVPAAPESQLEVSATQLSRLCQLSDAVANLQRNISMHSQWNSPAETAPVTTPQTSRLLDKVDLDYLKDLSGSPTKPCSPPRKDEQATYSRKKFNKRTEKASPKQINFDDDSDSKSCLSFDLSVQSDEGIAATPADNLDLNKSHLSEKLQDLSSFFSQSFTQQDFDVTMDGVFRYIMLVKSKRKEVNMLEWFRTAENFRLDETDSNRSFEGFPEEHESMDVPLSEASSDGVQDVFLDDDDELLMDVMKNGCTGNSRAVPPFADLDIESVLKSADRVLQQSSEFCYKLQDLSSDHIKGDSNAQQKSGSDRDINIEALLHGKILASLKDTSTCTSIPDLSPTKWNSSFKTSSTLTASAIELADDINSENLWNDLPIVFDDAKDFILPKPMDEKNLINMPSCSKSVFMNRNDWNCKFESPKSVSILAPSQTKQEKLPNEIDHTDWSSELNKTQFLEVDDFIIDATSVAGENINIPKGSLAQEFTDVASVSNHKSSHIQNVSNPRTMHGIKADLEKSLDISERVRIETNHFEDFVANTAFELTSKAGCGFQSASGKVLTVSETARLKANKLMEEDDFREVQNESGVLEKSGFKIASVNRLNQFTTGEFKFKSETTKQAASITSAFDSGFCSAIGSYSRTLDNKPVHGLSCGFQSAAGKILAVSESAKRKAEQLWKEADGLKETESENRKSDLARVYGFTPTSSNAMCSDKVMASAESAIPALGFQTALSCGFQSAAGKILAVSESAKRKAEQLWKEADGLKKTESENHKSGLARVCGFTAMSSNAMCSDKVMASAESAIPALGFQTASGKPMLVSKAAQEKAEKLLANVEDKDEHIQTYNTKSSNFLEGSELSGAELTSLLIQSSEKTITPKDQQPNSTLCDSFAYAKNESSKQFMSRPSAGLGFQSVSEKSFTISDAARTKAQKFLAEFEVDMEQQASVSHGFKSASGKGILISESARIRAEGLLSKVDETEAFKLLPDCKDFDATRLSNASNKEPDSNRREFERNSRDHLIPKRMLMKAEPSVVSPNRTPKRFNALQRYATSPLVKTPTTHQSQLVGTQSRLSLSKNKFKPPALVPDKFLTPNKSIPATSQLSTPNLQEFFDSVLTSTPKNCIKSRARHSFSLSQEISASTAALLEDESDHFIEATGMKQIDWDGFDESRKENYISSQGCGAISNVIKERTLKRWEQTKLIESKRLFEGMVDGGVLFRKKNQSNRKKLRDLTRSSTRPNLKEINLENALQYEFDAPNSVVSIPTEDGSDIIPDNENRIGPNEMKNALLALRTVAAQLIPTNWIEHHYKMIVLKLSWLETISIGYLTAQNVFLQLKYRYDYEIDRTHRSSLKRILECDDSPAKRIVLVVVAIHSTAIDTELELSDRWYTIRCSTDVAMHNFISAGKIQVGTKLMIQSAELLNCENGCSPLEVVDSVRLKIHTNSTRRAKWDTKLGFYRDPKPFKVRLDRIDVNGGGVAKLELCVLRVYPSLFKQNGKASGYHSEKVQLQIQKQQDKMKLSNIEEIFSQEQKRFDTEDNSVSSRSSARKKSIKDIVDAAELYELVRCDWDISEIECELSPHQLKLLQDYQQKIQNTRLEEVQRRVKARLEMQPNHIQTTEILKVRVIDIKNPKTSAILSIWHPHAEIKALLTEKTTFQASHITPKGIRCGELQLNSSKISKFVPLRNSNLSSNFIELFRHTTSIREMCSVNFKPSFNELDTCGLIVLIGSIQPKNFQPVYLADIDGNVVCLNFWSSIKDYGYDDVLQVKRFVAASNLQWRSNSASDSIPSAFVTELTILTENPKQPDMTNSLTEVRQKFSRMDLEEFASQCCERIKEIKSRPKLNGSRNSSFGNSSIDRSLNSTSPGVISVQTRIDRLRMYGNPPEITPLSSRKCGPLARKGFKLPVVAKDDS